MFSFMQTSIYVVTNRMSRRQLKKVEAEGKVQVRTAELIRFTSTLAVTSCLRCEWIIREARRRTECFMILRQNAKMCNGVRNRLADFEPTLPKFLFIHP